MLFLKFKGFISLRERNWKLFIHGENEDENVLLEIYKYVPLISEFYT